MKMIIAEFVAEFFLNSATNEKILKSYINLRKSKYRKALEIKGLWDIETPTVETVGVIKWWS